MLKYVRWIIIAVYGLKLLCSVVGPFGRIVIIGQILHDHHTLGRLHHKGLTGHIRMVVQQNVILVHFIAISSALRLKIHECFIFVVEHILDCECALVR